MKKYFIFIIGIFFFPQLEAQIIKNNNQCIGLGKFKLGDSKTKYNVTLINGGKYTYNNHEFEIYAYTPPDGEPVEILNTRFHSILMTFDDSERMVSLDIIKFYKKEEKLYFEKEARKNHRQLLKYFSEELNSKGVSKIFHSPYKKSDITKEQVWADKNSSLTVRKSSTSWHTTIQVIINTPWH